jgi:hypothetical protein
LHPKHRLDDVTDLFDSHQDQQEILGGLGNLVRLFKGLPFEWAARFKRPYRELGGAASRGGVRRPDLETFSKRTSGPHHRSAYDEHETVPFRVVHVQPETALGCAGPDRVGYF